MDRSFILFMLLLTYLPVVLIMAYTPYLTRKSESFGVGTPVDVHDHPSLCRLRALYRNRCLIFGGVIAVICMVSLLFDFKIYFTCFNAGLFAILAYCFVLYYDGHKKVLALKKAEKWSQKAPQTVYVETGFRKGSAISPLWMLLYPIIIGFTIMLSFAVYDRIPALMPTHFSTSGIADAYVAKSVKAIFIIPLVQTFMAVIMAFSYYMIIKSKPQAEAADPQQSLQRNKKFRYYWSCFIIFLGVLIMLMFAVFQMVSLGLLSSTIIMPVTLIFLAVIMLFTALLTVKFGQGGSRLAGDSAAGTEINRDEDSCWKAGLFYFNPDDPSLFVEKRFGIGWTLNFARPAAVSSFLAVVILIPLLIMLLTKWLSA